jgi:hypothetical protein
VNYLVEADVSETRAVSIFRDKVKGWDSERLHKMAGGGV